MKIISHRPRDNRYTLEGTMNDLRVADMIQINVQFKKNQFCVHGMSLLDYLRKFSGRYLHLLIHLLPHHGMPLRRYPPHADNDQEFAYLASIINAHPEYKYHVCISDPYRVQQLQHHFANSDERVTIGVMLTRYNLEQVLSVPPGIIRIVSIVDRKIVRNSSELVRKLKERMTVYCYVEKDMYDTLQSIVHGVIYIPNN